MVFLSQCADGIQTDSVFLLNGGAAARLGGMVTASFFFKFPSELLEDTILGMKVFC